MAAIELEDIQQEAILEISRQLTMAQHPEQLYELMHTAIKSKFPFKEAEFYFASDELCHPTIDGPYSCSLSSRTSGREHPFHYAGIRESNCLYQGENEEGVITELCYEGSSNGIPIDQAKVLKLTLNEGQQTLGWLYITFEHSKDLETNHQFFCALREYMAPVFRNILNNLQADLREAELKLLLDINEAIASVSNKSELFQVISEKLHPLSGQECIFHLITYDQTQSFLTVMFTSVDGQLNHGSMEPDEIADQLRVKDTAFEEVLLARQSYVINIEEKLAQHPNEYVFLEAKRVGIEEALICPLIYQGKTIASLHLHATKANYFTPYQCRLFDKISGQVAIAVADILTNDEIFIQKRRNEALLELSEKLAAIRDRYQLFQLVVSQVQPLFKSHPTTFLILIEPDGNQALLTFLDEDAGSQQLMFRRFNIKNTRFEELLLNGGISLLNADSLWDEPLERFLKEICTAQQIGEMMIGPLVAQNKTIGALILNAGKLKEFNPGQQPLFKTVCEQIASCLSNIKSKETLERKNKEASLQLAVNNTILKSTSKEELTHGIANVLNQFIPMDYFAFWLFNENRELIFWDFLGQKNGDMVVYKKEILAKIPTLIENAPLNLQLLNKTEGAMSKEEMAQIYANSMVFKEGKRFLNLKSLIRLVFELNGYLGVMVIMSKSDEKVYHKTDFDFIHRCKHQISLAINNYIAFEEIHRLKVLAEQEKNYLAEEIKVDHNSEEMIGTGEALDQVLHQIRKVATTKTTVLIMGETGTGKELVARALHTMSDRSDKPLIKINCAALPEQLIESELFGHLKGSFTGAMNNRIGKFELADGGTIFLDEIGELPLDIQSKLLRVIQEREIEAVG